ncbi:MAG: serine/threonine protein kinase [Candidatus Sumerlaeia bacterium]|nr:serine/threonine protein kinase [Candidatus Sumerlaeia bacterium]
MARETDTREGLQNSFEELQAHLKQRRHGGNARPTTPGREKSAEEAIFDLAKREGFEVRSILGMGGMGAVVRAVDTKLNRTVALKFLPPSLIVKEDNARKLRNEAELASSINHENVVNILSWHEVESVPFYAMEYIEGENLEEMVRRRGKLSIAESFRIGLEAAHGLEALHKVNIIHRDIKPENIMISNDGRVKITDFGISRTTDHIMKEVHEGKIAGSPKFMSPEQARGEAATGHSDIYSLGAVIYFMLTGHAPVQGSANIREVIQNVREGKLVPIIKYLPKLNRDIAKFVMRSMHQNPTKRAFNIETYKQDLASALLKQNEKSHHPAIDFVLHHWKTAVPVLIFSAGVGAGVIVGKEVLSTGDETNQALQQSLLRIGSNKKDQFERFVATEISTENSRNLAMQLATAVEHRDSERIAELLPAVDREMYYLQGLQQIRFAMNDEHSPLREIALDKNEKLHDASALEMDAMLASWSNSWIAYLAANIPPPETPLPEHPESMEAEHHQVTTPASTQQSAFPEGEPDDLR